MQAPVNLQFEYFNTNDRRSIRYIVQPAVKVASKGTVILLNGRTEFIEKHVETMGELNARGLDVYSLDWCGQGMSSRFLADRAKGHIGSYEQYLGDLNLFVRKIVFHKAAFPLIVLAHSMGGHIALRFMHRHPKIFTQAVLVAPMISINTAPLPIRFVRKLSSIAVKAGFGASYVVGSNWKGSYTGGFKGNRLTSDIHRFKSQKALIQSKPELALGGVTYGWLKATFESMDILQAETNASAIDMPILMVSAGADKIVSNKAQNLLCRKLPNCCLKTIDNAKHEILMESDAVRTRFWDLFDAFINLV